MNNSSNEFNLFNSRFLVKTDLSTNHNDGNDDDDDDDDEFNDNANISDSLLDSLNFDDNEALAQNNDSLGLENNLATVLNSASQAESSSSQELLEDKRKLMLLLKRKKQKRLKNSCSSLSNLPQYEMMQVNTRFISNTESKQIDTLTTINTFNRQYSSGSSGNSDNATEFGSDHADSLLSLHQMTEESRVLCVARRIPNSEQMQSGNNSNNQNVQVEHFSTRLDCYGRVISVDVTGMSPNIGKRYIQFLRNNLVNNLLHDFVHPDDLSKVQQHLKEAIINGSGSPQAAILKLYRLKVRFFLIYFDN